MAGKTPNRPSFASESSILSVDSTFSELSIFDHESAGEQTPITPFDTPKSDYFPKIKQDTSNGLRRLLWKKAPGVHDTKDSESSATSMLEVPNPIFRGRASSAPERGQTTGRNQVDEDIELLVRGLEDMDLGSDAANSPSFKKSKRNRRGRQQNTEIRNVLGDEDGRSYASSVKQLQKQQNADQSTTNTEKAQALDVLDTRGGGHARNVSAPNLLLSKDEVIGSRHRSPSLDIDVPVLPTMGIENGTDHGNSLWEENVVANVIPDSNTAPKRKSKKSLNTPPKDIKGHLHSPKPKSEDLESIPLDRSLTPDAPDLEQTVSSTAKAPKSQKSKARPTSKSAGDPAITYTNLGPYHPVPRSKKEIRAGILHVLRNRKYDRKPIPKSNLKLHATKDTKTDVVTGTIPKQLSQKNQYDNSAGYIYIFTSPPYSKYFKIGKTIKHPDERREEWQHKCKFKATPISDPNVQSFRHYSMVERLVAEELYNERRKFKCGICKKNHRLPLKKMKGDGAMSGQKPSTETEHGEWYEVSQEHALAVVQRWRKWVIQNDPYWEDGSLRDIWIWKANQVQNSVEMEWNRWFQTKLPKKVQKMDSAERDWDWDRWQQIRWDDWLCYIFYRLDLEVKSIWRPLMELLWYPGLLVWVLVGVTPTLAYSACGGGKWGLCASFGVIGAILASWLHFGC